LPPPHTIFFEKKAKDYPATTTFFLGSEYLLPRMTAPLKTKPKPKATKANVSNARRTTADALQELSLAVLHLVDNQPREALAKANHARVLAGTIYPRKSNRGAQQLNASSLSQKPKDDEVYHDDFHSFGSESKSATKSNSSKSKSSKSNSSKSKSSAPKPFEVIEVGKWANEVSQEQRRSATSI
jgi:hypothetical protein